MGLGAKDGSAKSKCCSGQSEKPLGLEENISLELKQARTPLSPLGRQETHTSTLYLNHRCVIPLRLVQIAFPPSSKAFPVQI